MEVVEVRGTTWGSGMRRSMGENIHKGGREIEVSEHTNCVTSSNGYSCRQVSHHVAGFSSALVSNTGRWRLAGHIVTQIHVNQERNPAKVCGCRLQNISHLGGWPGARLAPRREKPRLLPRFLLRFTSPSHGLGALADRFQAGT